MAATKSEQFEYNENPADAGFLLSGDTTGVFARCIAQVPLSYRRSNPSKLQSLAILRGFFISANPCVFNFALKLFAAEYFIFVIVG